MYSMDMMTGTNMMISGEVGNLQSQLQKLRVQQTDLDHQLNNSVRSKAGALNMDFFRIKKQQEEVREQVVKIHGMLRPDIIA
jgi:hypothetical protein